MTILQESIYSLSPFRRAGALTLKQGALDFEHAAPAFPHGFPLQEMVDDGIRERGEIPVAAGDSGRYMIFGVQDAGN